MAWSIEALRPYEQTPARHHAFLLRELEQVANGTTDRLMVFMPPGSAKTRYASIMFPAWMLSRRIGIDMIGASYNGEYAEWISEQLMRVIRENSAILGYSLLNDSKKFWSTTNRGQYRAAGAQGGITGRRADLVVLDDPIKGREDADSPTIREKVWNWYRAEVITRLKPGGRIVLIQTRWHPDDLAGRLLAAMAADSGDRWRIVNLPAIAEADDQLGREPGEALWPEWENRDALERKRMSVGPREWAALYQQRPAPREGSLFKREHFVILPAAPTTQGRIVRAWDLAATEKMHGNDPDYTVGIKLQRDPTGRIIVLDVVRVRGGPSEVERTILNTAQRDGHGVRIGLPQDPGGAGKHLVQYLTKALSGFTVQSSPETGSKETRAMPLASQVEVGNVALVQAKWNLDLIDELADFPAGSHDDQVDALSRGFGMLVALNDTMIFTEASVRRAAQPPRSIAR